MFYSKSKFLFFNFVFKRLKSNSNQNNIGLFVWVMLNDCNVWIVYSRTDLWNSLGSRWRWGSRGRRGRRRTGGRSRTTSRSESEWATRRATTDWLWYSLSPPTEWNHLPSVSIWKPFMWNVHSLLTIPPSSKAGVAFCNSDTELTIDCLVMKICHVRFGLAWLSHCLPGSSCETWSLIVTQMKHAFPYLT